MVQGQALPHRLPSIVEGRECAPQELERSARSHDVSHDVASRTTPRWFPRNVPRASHRLIVFENCGIEVMVFVGDFLCHPGAGLCNYLE